MRNLSFRNVAGALSLLVGLGAIGGVFYTQSSRQIPATLENPNVKTLEIARADLERNLSDSQQQLSAELKDVEANFDLPQHATFSSDYSFLEIRDQLEQIEAQMQVDSSTKAKFEPELVWYEPGYFKSDALVQWQCAWLKEAVIAREANDNIALEAALAQLESFKQREEIAMFPDYDVFFNENVAPIRRGDTAPAREFINSGFSCVEQNQL
ncbi:hypothetical protein ABYF32_04590 [Buchananella felis]|uniref:hypothetical protein n=1 Tax=Buchananella felis TaxID=3231492 RepID=UPI003527A499